MFALGTGTGIDGQRPVRRAWPRSRRRRPTPPTAWTYRPPITPSSRGTVTDEQSDETTAEAATKTQLTQQYAAMDSKIAAYKSTQTFLTAQIAAWNKTTS